MARSELTNFRVTIKTVELVLICTIMGLYTNAPVLSANNHLIHFLNPVALGGYIFIITGLIIGLVIDERVPRKMDMLYMIWGFFLFMAAGSVQINSYKTKSDNYPHFKDRELQMILGFTSGAFTIVTSIVFLMDIVLTYMDKAEYGKPLLDQYHTAHI
ncbi:uncharacterized protein [Periplaneta americana]|uniref:uncharacterized protein n=1 Tax=Periplaneta americana TaxID=6978 RepID=UPI0037E94084